MRDPLETFFGKSSLPKPSRPGNFSTHERREEDSKGDMLDALPSRKYLVDGVPKSFYTVGALARALGRSPVTIRSWESKGWIPSAAFRAPAPRSQQIPGKASMGHRLYSREQIEFLVHAFYLFRLDKVKGHDWPGFRQHIQDNYPRK
jgi:hypothetical protein